MYRDILYREIAATKILQAEKYVPTDPDTAKMLRGQASYFETLAAAEEARRDEAERDEFRSEILAAVDQRVQSALAQRQRPPSQKRFSEGSNPSGATSFTDRAKEAWNTLRGKMAER